MIKIWGGKSTAKEMANAVLSGMYLGNLNCEELCARYNLELVAFPSSAVIQRGNSRKIYRPSRGNMDKRQLIEVLIDSYLTKLYDPNYLVLSLQRNILECGGCEHYNLGKGRSNAYN